VRARQNGHLLLQALHLNCHTLCYAWLVSHRHCNRAGRPSTRSSMSFPQQGHLPFQRLALSRGILLQRLYAISELVAQLSQLHPHLFRVPLRLFMLCLGQQVLQLGLDRVRRTVQLMLQAFNAEVRA